MEADESHLSTITRAFARVNESLDKSNEELAAFWTAVQEMWLALYMSPLATVASISGHAPAGGCLLALACDYRVMVEGKYRIGLNESQIGIVAPPWLSRMMADTIGMRRAERMLQLGQLLAPEEAAAAGLVDEVVSLAQLHGASQRALDELLALPHAARATVKRQLRGAAAEARPWDMVPVPPYPLTADERARPRTEVRAH